MLKKIYWLLVKKKKTLAVAESATGGLLSESLTRIPGSSAYFILGVVAYSNQAKTKLLKIPSSLIRKNGAVSQAVAEKMAAEVRRLARSDVSIAITGIAGPGGGTRKKPQGTVFIAAENKRKKIYRKFRFRGNRLAVRKQAVLKSLELLKDLIN